MDNAPPLKQAWHDFAMFVNEFNWKKSQWWAPIPAGYNIRNYDLPIYRRINEELGVKPFFSDFVTYDVMEDIWRFNENSEEIPNIKFDTVREWMGMDTSKAHAADFDAYQEAQLVVRILKLYRRLLPKVQFKDSFKNVPEV